MPTSSTVVTAKNALVAALQARPGLSGTTVSYAWPGPNAAASMIAIGGSVQATHEPAAAKAGRMHRNESFDLLVVCWALKGTDDANDAATVEAAGFALLAEVEGAVADDPQLGSTALLWSQPSRLDVDLVPFEGGWASVIVARIQVRARLT